MEGIKGEKLGRDKRGEGGIKGEKIGKDKMEEGENN